MSHSMTCRSLIEFLTPPLFFSIIDFSTIMTSIDETIADLNSQKMSNIRETAKKHELVESTLRRKWKDQTKSFQTVVYQSKHRLTQMKEETLITQINRLIDRDISFTNQIVRNLTKEMIQESIDKNWAKNFINRNKNRLKSIYLKNMNSDRIKSEYASMFKQFYDLVSELNLKFETKCSLDAYISISWLNISKNITLSSISFITETKKTFWLTMHSLSSE